MATGNETETLKKINDFEAQVHEDVRGVANTPELDGALEDFVTKIAELKAQINDPEAYTRKQLEVNEAYARLYDKLLAAQAKSIENREKILNYFVTIENEITSLPPYVQQNRLVDSNITFIRAKIQEIRGDISKYKPSVEIFNEFNIFMREEVPEIQFALEVMEGQRQTISQLVPEVAADPRIAELVTQLTKEIDVQIPKVGTSDFDSNKAIDYHEDLVAMVSIVSLSLDRKIKEGTNINAAKNALRNIEDAEVQRIGDTLGIDEPDRIKLANTFAIMMLEGDGLTAEEIITFYTSTKDLEPKTATEENIKKWVEQIEAQNTTGKVNGASVVGEMPEDMQYAIETDLKGPNTLKMMNVASSIYQAELNDYLNGVDNNRPLTELGFTDDDQIWKMEGFGDDAGEEFGLDMTDQEKKLVFLEAYTSVLAAVIKNPDEVGNLISTSGIPWWLWLSMIGGGLALGTAPFFYLLGRERTLKGIGAILKFTSKPISGTLRALKEVFVRNKANYEMMMNPDGGRLQPDARRFVLSQIQLIHARMNLPEGEKLSFEGDQYDRLSRAEGKKRIAAIEAAVGSAKQDFTTKEERDAAKEKDKTLVVRSPSDRFGFIQMDSSNTQKSNDCHLNKELILYIQGLSRSPNRSFFWRPNVHFRHQSFLDHAGSIGVRALEVGVPAVVGFIAGGPYGFYTGAAAGLLGSPGFRRTFIGGDILRLKQSRQSGFFIQDSRESDRVSRWTGLIDLHKMANRIGQDIFESKEINLLTCSIEDIESGIDFLKQFVNASSESSSVNGSIYSEDEVFSAIQKALLKQKGQTMTRLELRLHIIRSVYLLRETTGVIPKAIVDKFIGDILDNRYSHSDADKIDTLYTKITSHKENKIPKHELSLITRQIEAIYSGHEIATTSIKSGENTTDVLFPGLDTTSNRLSEPDMDTIMSSALVHMQSHNDTVAKDDRMTREEFAEYIMLQLGTQNPPIGYPLHDRFDELWAGDVLRREGLDPLVKKIQEGNIATIDELRTNFLRTIGKPDLTSLSPEESEGLTILNDKYSHFLNEQESKVNATKIVELFDSAVDKNSAKIEFVRIFEDKAMRIVALSVIGPDVYSVEGGEHKVNKKKIEDSFDSQWNTWMTQNIATVKSDFDSDPLFENSHDVREKIRKFMMKCSPEQKREIAEHFRSGLERIVQDTDETKTPRKNRHKALVLLEDSSLVLEHIPPVAQEPLKELIKIQKEALKKLDENDDKVKKQTEIAKEIQTIKDDILSDPLARGIEDRIDATLDKCGDDKELRKKFAKELAVHFRDELMKRVNSNDPVLIESSKSALVLLTSPHIRDYLSTTDNDALKAFIEKHTKALEIQVLEKRMQPLKDSITTSVLEDTVEDELAKVVAELNQNPNLLEQKRALIRHYRDALITLLQDSSSIDAHREEALAHLESDIVVQSLPKLEQGELKAFVIGQKEKKIEKSVQELKSQIQKQPFSVEKSIRALFAQPDCTENQKGEIIRTYVDVLKTIATDLQFSPDQRATALVALRTDIITSNLTLVQQTELSRFIKTQEDAIQALERITKRRKENAEKLVKTLSDILKGKVTPAEQKTALDGLMEGKVLTLGQKNIIREFFPEEGTEEPTAEQIEGCIHSMIYATQDVVGFTDDIVEAHRILSEDQTLLTNINLQLRALQLAEIDAQVSDNVRARR